MAIVRYLRAKAVDHYLQDKHSDLPDIIILDLMQTRTQAFVAFGFAMEGLLGAHMARNDQQNDQLNNCEAYATSSRIPRKG
jgi:hypothetical protein